MFTRFPAIETSCFRHITVIGVLFLCSVLPAFAPAAEQEQFIAEFDELALFMSADQLVEVATRSPKPLSQVAENITIVTAEEIEAMNAHTVAEILNRVTGVIVDGNYSDFGSGSSVFIQGSDYENVLVLVDGVRWGYVSYDYPETNTIPVQIIKRIEVIRGAASSTWGSSLGGVVNIITKDTGTQTRPTGTLSGSYGESNSADFRGDAAGRFGQLSYYLYGGYQDSNGIKDNRFFENESFYGKFSLDLPRDMELGATVGYSRPDYVWYYLPVWDDEWRVNDRAFFATAFFSIQLGSAFSLNLSGYRFEDTITNSGHEISTGNLYYRDDYEGRSTGLGARLTWNGARQTLVLGAETERRKSSDHFYEPVSPTVNSAEEVWAVFINDTIRLGRLTLIPGLRYDHISVADDEISPSIGMTFQATDTSLLRASVSRGFRKPYATQFVYAWADPDLESETIWSYQAGIETVAIPFLRLKATIFDHEVEGAWVYDANPPWLLINGDDYQRLGMELEIETASFYNFSLSTNGTAIKLKPENNASGTYYLLNILLQYDDGTWGAQLFGHNVWFDDVIDSVYITEEKTGKFLWDLVVDRQFDLGLNTTAEIFAALHNITDEDQYTQWYFPNAGRWFEAGFRINY